MATSTWKISGEYFEACSCDSVCPCPTSGMAARPTAGSCDAGLVFNVQRGQYGSTMIDGNWTVGVVLDERASQEQREALTAIASGQAGGPMAAVGPLVGTFAGVESRPIRIERDGMRRGAAIPGL